MRRQCSLRRYRVSNTAGEFWRACSDSAYRSRHSTYPGGDIIRTEYKIGFITAVLLLSSLALLVGAESNADSEGKETQQYWNYKTDTNEQFASFSLNNGTEVLDSGYNAGNWDMSKKLAVRAAYAKVLTASNHNPTSVSISIKIDDGTVQNVNATMTQSDDGKSAVAEVQWSDSIAGLSISGHFYHLKPMYEVNKSYYTVYKTADKAYGAAAATALGMDLILDSSDGASFTNIQIVVHMVGPNTSATSGVDSSFTITSVPP